MEPTTLTATAIATLAFQKFLETGAGELAKQFTTAARAKMDELRQMIWDKLRGNSKAENALTKAEQGSSTDLEQVADYLKVVMNEEPEFAQEIQALAQEIHAGKLQDNSSMTQINRDHARGWQTKVEGGTAYIGEIHIQDHSPKT